MHVRSDFELVNAVLDGQTQDFAPLIKRHEGSVRAICRNVLRDSHAADDAAQEAFIKAYEKLGTLRKAESFGYWLTRIAKRCALSIAQRKPVESQLDMQTYQLAEKRNGQLDEQKQLLLEAILKLPKAQQQVVMLRYFGRHSVKDVAGITARSVGTVTKQLSRAHKALERLMRDN
jgi:RNA polymerase sigma-70 factor (ECF subfamily)